MAIVDDLGLAPVQVHRVTGLNNVMTPHVVNSSEIIGIEVEVENYRVRGDGSLNRAWQVTDDGSLRNDGIELITKPIAASAAPVCLEYLMHQYLSDECCFSPRTSVHVHINVQDLSRPSAMDMVLLYTVFEKLFYQYAGRGRQKNIYCVPITECNILTNLVDFTDPSRDNRWLKYTGLNTLPIRQYGTIEFRHMHGTTDVGKLSAWIGMIAKLKEYVRKTSTKDIRSMIAQMNDGFDFGRLLSDIFGDYARLLQYRGPQDLTYMHAKQALVPHAHTRSIRLAANRESAFLKFKG